MATMGIPDKHLADGESVVMTLRTHGKALTGPVIVLLLAIAAVTAGWTLIENQPTWSWVITGIAVLAAIVWSFYPYLNWLTTKYVITNKRIVTRSGILTRKGRDIPLYRINDVSYDMGFFDRILGCGTLTISDASENSGMKLPDIPRVENVQSRLHGLLFAHDDGTDEGEFPPTEPPRVGGAPV